MPFAERRIHPRLPVQMSTLVLQERCVEADRATLRDLSWSGAFLALPWPVPVGRRLRLIVRLASTREEVRIHAKVVRVAKDGVAVRFEALDYQAEAALRELLGSYAPVHEAASEKTLPLHGLRPAANDLPAVLPQPWSLRGTLQRLLQRSVG